MVCSSTCGMWYLQLVWWVIRVLCSVSRGLLCLLCVQYVVFFFKQKTACEIRISDLSSDVCSSDLQALMHGNALAEAHELHGDLPLIVVHRQHAIVAAAIGFVDGANEGGVGRTRAFRMKPPASGQFHPWFDDFDFVPAAGTPIAVMRVQAA